jgi:hypothetical protein
MTMEPRHLDGNAIGGLMVELFGGEMTAAQGCCATCGAVNVLAVLVVYQAGPGDVARCPACGSVVFVISALAGSPRLHLVGLRWVEPPR